jgi:phosphatidylethanolamine-binding protein (PEBP) family uncharacterized protein
MKIIIQILLVFMMIGSTILAGCSGALSSPTPQPESSEIQGVSPTNQEQFLPEETDKMKTPPTGGQQQVNRPPQGNLPQAGRIEPSSANSSAINKIFVLSSPEVVEGGMLPKEYTCDGNSATLPLEWSGIPANTKSIAIVMYTIPSPNESHWYWVLYNIPPNVQNLVKNVTGVGTLGNNGVNGKTEYSPPCSKGPGAKLYTYTIYAMSALPQFAVPPAKVSRDVLLSAIKDITLDSAELNVFYSR